MADEQVPEIPSDTKVEPIPGPKVTDIDDKPCVVPPFVEHKATALDKVAANKWWVGTKHFIYGFSIAATASLVAGAHPYLAIGLGVAGGVAEATRKVAKEKAAESGNDWADILDKILSIIVALVEALKKRKEVKQ